MRGAFITTILAVFILAGGPLPVDAQDAAPAREKATPAKPDTPVNPHEEEVRNQAMALTKELNEQETQALTETLKGFGIIRAVRIARTDVGDTVEKCIKANPGLKDDMSGRFSAWKGAVDPLLESHEKKLADSISSGIFRESGKIKSYLDAIDRMADFADNAIDKKASTTPESCLALKDSMDRTQERLVKVLSSVQWAGKEQAPKAE